MTIIDIGETGNLDAGSHTPCPNCKTDCGYYGDLVGRFTCEQCGFSFEVYRSEQLIWERVP